MDLKKITKFINGLTYLKQDTFVQHINDCITCFVFHIVTPFTEIYHACSILTCTHLTFFETQNPFQTFLIRKIPSNNARSSFKNKPTNKAFWKNDYYKPRAYLTELYSNGISFYWLQDSPNYQKRGAGDYVSYKVSENEGMISNVAAPSNGTWTTRCKCAFEAM